MSFFTIDLHFGGDRPEISKLFYGNVEEYETQVKIVEWLWDELYYVKPFGDSSLYDVLQLHADMETQYERKVDELKELDYGFDEKYYVHKKPPSLLSWVMGAYEKTYSEMTTNVVTY